MKKKSREFKSLEDRTLLYKTTFDPLIARLYNNKKCNQCNGRGYVIVQTPLEGVSSLRKNQPTRNIQTYCKCVDKNVKKQRQAEWKNYKS